jgi:hypothetical protein
LEKKSLSTLGQLQLWICLTTEYTTIHNRMWHNCGGPKAPILRQTQKSHGWVTFLKVSYRTPIKWLVPRHISAYQQQNQIVRGRPKDFFGHSERTQHQGQHNQVCPKKSWSYYIYIYILYLLYIIYDIWYTFYTLYTLYTLHTLLHHMHM